MTDHVHAWTPIPLECARYECQCGATGYRNGAEIVEHKTKLQRYVRWTAGSAATQVRDRIRKDYEG